MTNMKVKRQLYYPNFVGEKEKKKKEILFYLAQLSRSIILC